VEELPRLLALIGRSAEHPDLSADELERLRERSSAVSPAERRDVPQAFAAFSRLL